MKNPSDSKQSNSFVNCLKTAVCGLFMGMADVVPGVSGGTVALVLGIYSRLVTAISHVDRRLVSHVKNREFGAAAKHLDLGFLVCLATGIGLGFVITIVTLSKLLSDETMRPYVQATFFGLVLGAAWIVYRMIRGHESDRRVQWLAVVVGFAIAATISWMSPSTAGGDPPLWWLFIYGMVAICAMILPGISGALILVLLGCYGYMVDVIKAILHREDLATNLPIAAVFATGCVVGLLTFTKILRRLLEQKYGATMSMLCGLMLGSLFKLWPYQKDMTPHEDEFRHKVFQPALPEGIGLESLMLLITAILAVVAVIGFERLAARLK